MPTYIVTDNETGRKFKLTGDSPPTEQELSEIFGASRANEYKPDTGGPFRVGIGPFSTEINVSPGVGEALVGLGRGATNVIQGGHQAISDLGSVTGEARPGIAEDVTSRINDEKALWDRNATPAMKNYETAGEVASMFAVPGATTARGAALVGGLIGAATTQEGDTPEERMYGRGKDAAVVGATSMAFTGLVNRITANIADRRVAKEVADEMYKQAKRMGFPIEPTDLIDPRKPGFFGGGLASLEQFVAKMPFYGSKIKAQRGTQFNQIGDMARSLVDRSGTLSDDAATIIAQSAGTNYQKHRQIAHKLYQRVEGYFTGHDIPINSLENAYNAIKSKVTTPSVLKELDDIMEIARKDKSYTNLISNPDSVKNKISNLFAKYEGEGAVRMSPHLRELKNALNTDLTNAARTMGGDALDAHNSAQRFYAKKVAIVDDGPRREMFKRLTGVDPGDVPFSGPISKLDPKNAVNAVKEALASGEPVKINKLWGLLRNDGKEAVRVSVLQEAFDEATKKGDFNPLMFANTLNKYVKALNPDKSGELASRLFFGPMSDEVRGFIKLSKMTEKGSRILQEQMTGYSGTAIAAAAVTGLMFQPQYWEEALGVAGPAVGISLMFTTRPGRAFLKSVATATAPDAVAAAVNEFSRQLPKLVNGTVREFVDDN